MLALIASGLAIAGWFRPTPPPPPAVPTFTDQQVADAKARACTAFELVEKGVEVQTHGEPSDDPGLIEAQASNGRLSIIAGAWYLRDQLSPATPPALATAIQEATNNMLDLGAGYIAGAENSDAHQAMLRDSAETDFQHVAEVCQ